ncbi:MAG: TetR/AcrR family transcriptional regulator [Betaproteobacteria bacterium]|nr:MAG: TetR/AcrR family transcriptional regulator [Betaproteobacteria bacterium]
MPVKALKSTRSDNRVTAVLDAAARLFAVKGYSATTMRDIAEACDMLPGSLYYHFAAKEDLLVAVYEAGVRQLVDNMRAAIREESDPWARLEAGCAAHLETLLRQSDYAQVLVRVLPADVGHAAARLKALRAEYERSFRDLVGALLLPPGTDRGVLRLMLLGALNWSRFWFAEGGRDTPRSLARKFVHLLRETQHA